MVMVLILISVLAAVGYGLWTRTADFAENWPNTAKFCSRPPAPWKAESGESRGRFHRLRRSKARHPQRRRGRNPSIVRTLIFRGIGSLYALFLEITFMPFLVFFMLAEKTRGLARDVAALSRPRAGRK